MPGQSAFNGPSEGPLLDYHYVDTTIGYADGDKRLGSTRSTLATDGLLFRRIREVEVCSVGFWENGNGMNSCKQCHYRCSPIKKKNGRSFPGNYKKLQMHFPFPSLSCRYHRVCTSHSLSSSQFPKRSTRPSHPDPLLSRTPPPYPIQTAALQNHRPRHPGFRSQRDRRAVQSIAVSIMDRRVRLLSCDSLHTILQSNEIRRREG